MADTNMGCILISTCMLNLYEPIVISGPFKTQEAGDNAFSPLLHKSYTELCSFLFTLNNLSWFYLNSIYEYICDTIFFGENTKSKRPFLNVIAQAIWLSWHSRLHLRSQGMFINVLNVTRFVGRLLSLSDNLSLSSHPPQTWRLSLHSQFYFEAGI